MKSLLLLFCVIIGLSSCEVNVVEPVYNYDARDRVTGSFDLKEYSATFNDLTYYQVQIAKSSYSGREIFVYNFYALDSKILAYLDGDRVTIPKQIVNDYEISGVGTLNGSSIDLNYTVYDLQGYSATDFCESQIILN